VAQGHSDGTAALSVRRPRSSYPFLHKTAVGPWTETEPRESGNQATNGIWTSVEAILGDTTNSRKVPYADLRCRRGEIRPFPFVMTLDNRTLRKPSVVQCRCIEKQGSSCFTRTPTEICGPGWPNRPSPESICQGRHPINLPKSADLRRSVYQNPETSCFEGFLPKSAVTNRRLT